MSFALHCYEFHGAGVCEGCKERRGYALRAGGRRPEKGACPEIYLEEAFRDRSQKTEIRGQRSGKKIAGCEGIGRDFFDVYGASDAYGREYALCGGAGEGGYGSRPG